jgi:hypothetical protein
MAALESLVRPFETPDATPGITGVASIPQLSPNVSLVVSASGQIKSGTWSYAWSFTTYADAKQKEQTQQG